MARFLRFDYLNEKHIINLDHVVSVMRVEDKEIPYTWLQTTSGSIEYSCETGLALWHALCGLVDRSMQVKQEGMGDDTTEADAVTDDSSIRFARL